MSKGKKKKRAAPKDLLAPVLEIFARGDYLRSRAELTALLDSPDLSEGEKKQARKLYDATLVERGTLYVGLGCLGLFVLVILVTLATQP